MEKKIVIISVLLVLLVIGFVGLIAAEVNDTDNSNNSTDKDYNNKSINWTTRCAAVNHRVEGRLAMYEENRDPHFTRFVRLADKLNEIINKSYVKGYNTSVLDADLVILNEKILKFQEDYTLFIQKLENTRNFTCGHSEGQFKAALNESKMQLRIVRQDAEDIKEFYKETIKKDIAELGKQIKADAEKRRTEREQHIDRFIQDRENRTRDAMEKIRNWTNNTKARVQRGAD